MRDPLTTHGRAITSFYVARRQCVNIHMFGLANVLHTSPVPQCITLRYFCSLSLSIQVFQHSAYLSSKCNIFLGRLSEIQKSNCLKNATTSIILANSIWIQIMITAHVHSRNVTNPRMRKIEIRCLTEVITLCIDSNTHLLYIYIYTYIYIYKFCQHDYV
jgi:hypothetical protein